MPVRHGSAEWQGTLKDGKGAIRIGKDRKTRPYNYRTRFENEQGSNPEELIGAAHAGCFSMALAHLLSQAGHTPERINTTGKVALEEKDGGYVISSITLECEASVSGVTLKDFQCFAESAKRDCPVSKLLAGTEILLEVKLV
ncbi:MAG: OsmC family protein [Bacteroidota bacterium]